MAAITGNMARRERGERRDNSGKAIATDTVPPSATIDLAAIRVQGNAMAPVYREGDVVIYCRPREDLALRPGDDVLVLLPGPAGSLQLLLRRLARWDNEALELRALNAGHPPVRENPRNAVLCGRVIGRLSRGTPGRSQ